jgi:hypothetical protein
LKLLLIALLVGLSPFSVNARLADAAAGVNALTDLADRTPVYTDLPTCTNIDGNVPTHRSFNAYDWKHVDAVIAERAKAALPTPTPTFTPWVPSREYTGFDLLIDIVKTILFVVYFIIWFSKIVPENLKYQGEDGFGHLFWGSPFNKAFATFYCIAGVIIGFISGYRGAGADESVLSHIMLGVLTGLFGGICGILANVLPIILVCIFGIVVLGAGIGGIGALIGKLFGHFTSR